MKVILAQKELDLPEDIEKALKDPQLINELTKVAQL
jgi:hypothetical protein